MFKYFYCIITVPLLMVSPLRSMEKIIDTLAPEIITRLPIKQALSVISLPNNTVVISNAHNCSIYNLLTTKKILQLEDIYPLHIAAHTNKTKFAVHSTTGLTVYDAITGNKDYETFKTHLHGIPCFNSVDNTILTGNNVGGIDSFNYKDSSCKSYHLPSIPKQLKMTFHPTKQECAFVTNKKEKIIILHFSENALIKKKILIKKYVNDCKYSPDGSLLAINNASQNCLILNPKSDEMNYLINNEDTALCTMAFHPTSFILATLSFSLTQGQINYWNAENQQLLVTTPLTALNRNYFPSTNNQRLDFSCDGTKLIIALNDECIIIKVPFQALYKAITKDVCIFTYWALQHYLPQDTSLIISAYLLASSKYSLNNLKIKNYNLLHNKNMI